MCSWISAHCARFSLVFGNSRHRLCVGWGEEKAEPYNTETANVATSLFLILVFGFLRFFRMITTNTFTVDNNYIMLKFNKRGVIDFRYLLRQQKVSETISFFFVFFFRGNFHGNVVVVQGKKRERKVTFCCRGLTLTQTRYIFDSYKFVLFTFNYSFFPLAHSGNSVWDLICKTRNFRDELNYPLVSATTTTATEKLLRENCAQYFSLLLNTYNHRLDVQLTFSMLISYIVSRFRH